VYSLKLSTSWTIATGTPNNWSSTSKVAYWRLVTAAYTPTMCWPWKSWKSW
jgi:hypothetical protein